MTVETPINEEVETKETSFGDLVKQRRKALGLTQARLAVLVGTNQQTVNRYEIGERVPATKKRFVDFARELKLPFSKFERFLISVHIKRRKTPVCILIRKRMAELGMTPKVLAEKLGVSPRVARFIRTRYKKSLRYDLARRLEGILGLPASDLTKFSSINEKETSHPAGAKIRERRKKLGLSQKELAEKVGLTSTQRISQMEKGIDFPKVGGEAFKRLAKGLGVSEEELREILASS